MTDQLDKMAEEFWQDDLAKFSPTLKQCPDAYKIMFRAGFEKGWAEKAKNILSELDRMKKEYD